MKINYVDGVFRFSFDKTDPLYHEALDLITSCRNLTEEIDYDNCFDHTPETEVAVMKWTAKHNLLVKCNQRGVSHTVVIRHPDIGTMVCYYRLTSTFPFSEKRRHAFSIALLTKRNNPEMEVELIQKEFFENADVPTKVEYFEIKEGMKYVQIKEPVLYNPN